MKLSAFTYIHNALAGGYPIVEAIRAVQPYVNEVVVLDCQSNDGTRELLNRMVDNRIMGQGIIKVIDGFWGNEAGETLRQAHSQYIKCSGDVIIHFEADEVYSDSLIREVNQQIHKGNTNLSVYRLQLEQNFQRCRWYPEPVHRVFPKYDNIRKDGHTTDKHYQALEISSEFGFLWDITNCFRDNWFNRISQQAELRNEREQYLMTNMHCLLECVLRHEDQARMKLDEAHWTWKVTPFNIPEILRPLVGVTKYEPNC